MTDFDPFAGSSVEDEAQAAPAADDTFDAPPAEAPAPAKKAPAKKTATKKVVDEKPNVLPVPETGISVTFKGGAGFESPWIVPKYGSVAEALVDFGLSQAEIDKLSPAQRWSELMTRTQKMAQFFVGQGSGSGGGGGQRRGGNGGGQRRQRQAPPKEAQEAPGGEKRYCEHGEMRFHSGVSKAGNPYQAFFCTSDDRNDECRAQFLR